MSGYLLDTNILSARLSFAALSKRKKVPPTNVRRVAERVGELPFIQISALTYWEIERGLLHVDAASKLHAFRAFCIAGVHVIPVDAVVLSIASKVWVASAHKGFRPPEVDALIVATAVAWDLTLVSRDKDVKRCAASQDPPCPLEDWFNESNLSE